MLTHTIHCNMNDNFSRIEAEITQIKKENLKQKNDLEQLSIATNRQIDAIINEVILIVDAFEKAEAKRLADEALRLKEEETAKAEVKPNPEPEPVKPKVNYSTYTIKKGDNLGKIAKKYHVSVDSLMKWNNLNSDFIREGQKLKIKK